MALNLTPEAQEAIKWVKEAGHPNDVSETDAPQEVKNFIDGHSCSDGFGYAMWKGGYAKPEDWIVDYDPKTFTTEQLSEFKELWEANTVEF